MRRHTASGLAFGVWRLAFGVCASLTSGASAPAPPLGSRAAVRLAALPSFARAREASLSSKEEGGEVRKAALPRTHTDSLAHGDQCCAVWGCWLMWES